MASYCFGVDQKLSSFWTSSHLALLTEFEFSALTAKNRVITRNHLSSPLSPSVLRRLPLLVWPGKLGPTACSSSGVNALPILNSTKKILFFSYFSKFNYLFYLFAERPDYDGGSMVTQYEVNLVNPDGSPRIVFSGYETECLVASLLPGRSYSFQVRASNRIGVTR